MAVANAYGDDQGLASAENFASNLRYVGLTEWRILNS